MILYYDEGRLKNPHNKVIVLLVLQNILTIHFIGFCSSESEAPGSLSGGGGLGRGGVGPPSHPHHSLRPQSRLVNASKYRLVLVR